MSDLTPAESENKEKQFLLFCLQGRFNSDALDWARAVTDRADFDWDAVRDMVYRERLAPLLYTVVRESQLLPFDFENDLRGSYLQYAFHNASQLEHLGNVIRDFAAEDLALIVLKGAALAETIYNNIAVRPMVDMDVLIRNLDVEKALRILKSRGYYPVDPETHPGMITDYENELLLFKTGKTDVALELHWSLLDSPHYQHKIDMDWFWQSANAARLNNIPGLVLGTEALLLHLCSHVTLHHGGGGLLWLHDVAEVLVQCREKIDWATLLDKAQEYDLVLSLQHVLNRVNLGWNLQLSEDILKKLNDLQPTSREVQVYNWLTARERPVAQRFWVDLATSNSWGRRVRYAWRNLVPSADYMSQRYEIKQSYLLPLYYPYRWLLGIISIFRN